MESRGKVCVMHLWGRLSSGPLALPWRLLALPVGAVLPVFRAPSLRRQDFGTSYEILDRITWDLNKAWRE
mgnify:CR=1 FL=1